MPKTTPETRFLVRWLDRTKPPKILPVSPDYVADKSVGDLEVARTFSTAKTVAATELTLAIDRLREMHAFVRRIRREDVVPTEAAPEPELDGVVEAGGGAALDTGEHELTDDGTSLTVTSPAPTQPMRLGDDGGAEASAGEDIGPPEGDVAAREGVTDDVEPDDLDERPF
jgi:hypothetical protein